MATYHVDLISGNDASAGTSWGTAWKTWLNGPTAARIAPGDTIKFAKSPDAVSIGSATWTNASANVTIDSSTYKEVHQAVGNTWTSSTNVTGGISFVRKLGASAQQFTFAAGFTSGKVAYAAISGGGTQNLSSFNKISFYFNSSSTTSAAMYEVRLCSDTTGDTAVDSFVLPIISTANVLIPITLERTGGGSLGSSIQSVAIYVVGADPGTSAIKINNIIATNDLHFQCLIGKSGEVYHPILNISGTTLVLDCANSTTATGVAYLGTTGSATTYAQPAVFHDATSVSILEAGTSSLRHTYTGGWDTGSDTQTSKTIMVGPKTLTMNQYTKIDGFGFIGLTANNTSAQNIYENCYFVNGVGFTAGTTTMWLKDVLMYMSNIFVGTTYAAVIANNCTFLTNSYVFSASAISGEFNNCYIAHQSGGSFGIQPYGRYVLNNCSFATNYSASPMTFPVGSRDVLSLIFRNCIGTTPANAVWTVGAWAKWQTSTLQGSDPGSWEITTTDPTSNGVNTPYRFKIADIVIVDGSTVTVTAWMKKSVASNSTFTVGLATVAGSVEGIPTQVDLHGANTNWEQLELVLTPTASGVLPIYAEVISSNTGDIAHVGSITITTS